MLQQFTWQQFLVAISALTLIWYLAVILIFYRKEVQAFIKGKPARNNENQSLPHHWDDKVDKLSQELQEELIGKSRMPEGVSIVDMEEMQFADIDTKNDKLGLIPDVIEDIKMIFQILGEQDGTKKDFLQLIQDVKKRYPKIASSSSLPQINDFIISNAFFHITPEELENLW